MAPTQHRNEKPVSLGAQAEDIPMAFRALGTALICSMVLTTAGLASAQSPPPAQSQAELKARCTQLIEFFDWYGADRSENSDGARNHTRIAAGVECSEGRYDEGVAHMEALLRRKAFDPSGSLTTPWKQAQAVASAPR